MFHKSRRIERRFTELRHAGRCGLIAYITCGDPSVDAAVDIALQLERAGADCIELGVPFSDPIADGPVIQAASQRALERGTTVADVLNVARAIRESSDVPLVAFSYLNPISAYGGDRFAEDAVASGIDAVLITDLPPESAGELRGIPKIFLAAPTTPDPRLRVIEKASDGFVYYVSLTGVTGTSDAFDVAHLKKVRRIIRKPLAVGFGISRKEHYLQLKPYCDAVVVGSAIVRAIAEGEPRGAAMRAAKVVRGILE